MNTENKGLTAVLQAQLHAAKLGYNVAIPTIPLRYDLILEKNGIFWRCQVKYCDTKHEKKHKDSITLDLKEGYSSNEIDILLVYIPKINEILWVNSKIFHKKYKIRFTINENGRYKYRKDKNYAKKYLWKK